MLPHRVYPRVGGGNAGSQGHPKQALGLSPRGRGKPSRQRRLIFNYRSIPAWAGETREFPTPTARAAVYPRVGGGNGIVRVALASGGGLSPRGRGKRGRAAARECQRGSIPAWAGETHAAADYGVIRGVYPRVGGGNRCSAKARRALSGLSPRGRGKRSANSTMFPALGSIPAWAGETVALFVIGAGLAVYPRVGGGN